MQFKHNINGNKTQRHTNKTQGNKNEKCFRFGQTQKKYKNYLFHVYWLLKEKQTF